MFTNLNLTDMETCCKVFRREVLTKIRIEEDRFGLSLTYYSLITPDATYRRFTGIH